MGSPGFSAGAWLISHHGVAVLAVCCFIMLPVKPEKPAGSMMIKLHQVHCQQQEQAVWCFPGLSCSWHC
jgi:hypothetical protein